MNRKLKLIGHLIGFIVAFIVGVFLLNLNPKTSFLIIQGICIGYVFCYITNKSN